jgi:hypothetical protein
MDPTKERNMGTSGKDDKSTEKEDVFSGDSVPRPLAFYREDADPSKVSSLRLGLHRAPAWSWPGSRGSACFPAEAYPPLRPLAVYSGEQFGETVN